MLPERSGAAWSTVSRSLYIYDVNRKLCSAVLIRASAGCAAPVLRDVRQSTIAGDVGCEMMSSLNVEETVRRLASHLQQSGGQSRSRTGSTTELSTVLCHG